MLLKLIGVYSTDFEVISQFLVTKSRDQIKRKFKMLERTNRAEMDEIFGKAPATPDRGMLERLQQLMEG